MHKLVIFLIASAALCLRYEAKVLTRCRLVTALYRHGFPDNQMSNWVCLIEAGSSRNTRFVGQPDTNGTREWGLFLINDKHWCSNTTLPGNNCNIQCAELIKYNIYEAARCAKLIYERHNFYGWHHWIKNCREKTLPDISDCS